MPYKSKQDRAAAQARYRERLRQAKEDAKAGGCVDCGESDPIVLQFHHRVVSEDNFRIGRATGTESLPRLLAEIDKCDVVCANCHLRRHAAQV